MAASNEWQTYDDFTDGTLDRWSTLEVPVGGELLRYEEPQALVTVDGRVEVDVPRFSVSADGLHMLDDPKHAYMSRSRFTLPATGQARFGFTMSAQSHGGNATDFRDGVAVFNVIDMENGAVFDFATSGERIWVIHERLALPGLKDPFTYLTESPFAVATSPGRSHEYAIELDAARHTVRWFVDGDVFYVANGIEVPRSVQLGFGLFTLHPQADGKSQSIRGQGMRGTWRNVRFAGAEVVPG